MRAGFRFSNTQDLTHVLDQLLLPGGDLTLAPLLRCDAESLTQVATAAGLFHQEVRLHDESGMVLHSHSCCYIQMAGLGRGVPGHPVLPEDKRLLCLKPTRAKNEGEIVGVRNDQNIMVYALVLASEASAGDEDCGLQEVSLACTQEVRLGCSCML